MFPLPPEIISLLANFAPVFDKRVWEHAVVLLIGAILAPGKRTVTAALRIMGLSDEKHFINYHRVLSRATWSGLALSRILFGLLVALLLSANAPILIVIDDTLERRRGAKIKAKGVFRDAVRSSEKHLVTCFGLRWVCMMLLVPLPWATRPWALPFLTVLAPSERTQTKQGKRHKSCVDWARQMLKQVYRWCATRPLVLLVDGGYAAVSLGLACSALPHPAILVTRLRLDASLYDPPLPPADLSVPKVAYEGGKVSVQIKNTGATDFSGNVRIVCVAANAWLRGFVGNPTYARPPASSDQSVKLSIARGVTTTFNPNISIDPTVTYLSLHCVAGLDGDPTPDDNQNGSAIP